MIMVGIQARSGSTRLRHKSMRTIGGVSILTHCFHACAAQGFLTVVLPYEDDDRMIEHCCINELDFYPTPCEENDVLGRYVAAAKHFSADYIVRITGDCPFPNPSIPTNIGLYSFWSNAHPKLRTAPDGWDTEIISAETLRELDATSTTREREHVTARIYKDPNLFSGSIYFHRDVFDLSKLPKMSVDTIEDLNRMRRLYVG